MPTSARTILSVSELNAEVNVLLTRGFPLLWVEGEISNLARPSSGHLYFTLKDNNAQIRAAMFRNRNLKLSIKPENGMKVLVRGRIGLYESRGDYQLIAEHLEDAGVGQLQKQFEALKQKLNDAGLFDNEHKQALPKHPRRIGIITSPTGAAVRDILTVLSRRSPQTPILIYPVAVQGEAAKTEIEAAIHRANAEAKCDVLILARGGGSIEDLWAFNEENVARAIHQSNIPIISGVGHEIDTTIADFVADKRAATPSAAAEQVAPERQQLLLAIKQQQQNLQRAIERYLQQKQQRCDALEARLHIQQPAAKIQRQNTQLQQMQHHLTQSAQQFIGQKKHRLNTALTRLQAHSPQQNIALQKQHLQQQTTQLQDNIQRFIKNRSAILALHMAKLDTVSPLKTLDRGFSITKDQKSGTLIRSAKQIQDQQALTIQFSDGECAVIAQADKANSSKNAKNAPDETS